MINYDPEQYSQILYVIDIGSISINFAISIFLGYVFLHYFTDKKSTAWIGTIAFHIPVIIWTWIPIDTELIRLLVMFIYIALSFGAMYGYERTRPKQKLLAVLMIYTFRGLSMVVSSEINTPIVNYVFGNPKLNRLEWLLPEYIGTDMIEHTTFFIFYLVLIKLYHKSYGDRDYEPDINGFLILCIPAVSHYISRRLYRENYATYVEYYNSLVELDDIETLQNLTWGSYTRIFEAVVSAAFLLAIVYLYRQSQKTEAQKSEEQLLEIQLNETRARLSQTETIYNEMRSMKHDMHHQIRILSELVEKGELAEASRGLAVLERQADEVIKDMSTGHPVIDILLMDFKREAEGEGISFETDFSYNESSGIDVFDLSMVLSNAISNAINACKDIDDAHIFVGGKPKQNMFLITVKNSFYGKMPAVLDRINNTTPNSLPIHHNGRHGYGVTNIKRIVMKYYGDISYEKIDDTIVFTAMFQLSQQ